MLMTTFALRLRESRLAKGLSQNELADKAGVSQSLITKIESGNAQESRKASKLASVLGVDTNWLVTGKQPDYIEGEVIRQENTNSDKTGNNNLAIYTGKQKMIPLISWVQAGAWCEAIDNYSVGDAEDWLPCPNNCSDNTYALKVRGDSMTAPHGLSFIEGCFIYVDPLMPITSGCKVIAKLEISNEVTFKEYREDGGKRYLKPLNPQYLMQEITADTHICGVIVGMYIPC
jgi:SOS-response transcriptional repressor LexA